MEKPTRTLLCTLAALVLGWSLLGSILAGVAIRDLSREVADLRREQSGDTTYLRYRIRVLESELEAEELPERPVSVTNTPAEESSPSPSREESVPPAGESVPPDRESVTLPTHKGPETLPAEASGTESAPAETDTPDVSNTADVTDTADEIDTPPAEGIPYYLAEHRGVIGLFSPLGELLETCNVFVLALPPADREALAEGIPVASYAEGLELLERYG